MTALVKNLSDFLSLLIQSFNLSSIFPSVIFVGLFNLSVIPSIPENSMFNIFYNLKSESMMFCNFILVILIGYLLDAANIIIIRFFEGYHFACKFPFDTLKRRNQEHVIYTIEKIRELEKEWIKYNKEAENESNEKLKDTIADMIYSYQQQIYNKYPDDIDYVLSLPLGNVVASAEQYPKKTFGMDAIILWPFLCPILTEKNYAQFVMKQKATMDFLLNMTVVLLTFGFSYFLIINYYNGFSSFLLLKTVLVFIFAYLMYRLSIQSAAGWGATIKSAFVLFREELRVALKLKTPDSFKKERELWECTSSFFSGDMSDEEQLKFGNLIFQGQCDKDNKKRA